MAHIPKRATQHGLFVPSAETAPPTLKPGQRELRRRDLYSDEVKPQRETYFTQDQFKGSEYSKEVADVMLPEDYVFRTKSCKPPHIPLGALNTSHWRSEYNVAHSDRSEGCVTRRQRGPPYRAADPPACLGRTEDTTFYRHEFGRHGSNPRDRVRDGDTKLPSLKTALTLGTPKGTNHIPGYQGFLPANANSQEAARVGHGSDILEINQINLVQTYHTNLVGYAGHIPQSARNDLGGRRPTDLTVAGKDFAETYR